MRSWILSIITQSSVSHDHSNMRRNSCAASYFCGNHDIFSQDEQRVWMHVNEHKGKRTSRFPLALFSTPWVRDTAGTRHTSVLVDSAWACVCVIVCCSLTLVDDDALHASFQLVVDLRRLTVPLSIRSCWDRRVFRRLISLFSSSSWWHAHTHTHARAHRHTPTHTHAQHPQPHQTQTHARTHTHTRHS